MLNDSILCNANNHVPQKRLPFHMLRNLEKVSSFFVSFVEVLHNKSGLLKYNELLETYKLLFSNYLLLPLVEATRMTGNLRTF